MALIAALLGLCVQEVLSITLFGLLKGSPFWIFILYTLLQGVCIYLWGTLSDLWPRKNCIVASLFLGGIPIALIKVSLLWAVITSPLLLPAAMIRAMLADHDIRFFNKQLNTRTLMKLSWLVVYVTWAGFLLIESYPMMLLLSAWGLALIFAFVLPRYPSTSKPFSLKSILDAITPDFHQIRHFLKGLTAFALFELVFFIMWSFSEKSSILGPNLNKNILNHFFPFVGVCSAIGVILSFFFSKQQNKHQLDIIGNAYLNIILIISVAGLVGWYFPSQNHVAWWILMAFVSAFGGIYLPYIYNELLRFFGKKERGQACGTAEIFSSIPESIGAIPVARLNNYLILTFVLLIISIIGYTMHARQPSSVVSTKK